MSPSHAYTSKPAPARAAKPKTGGTSPVARKKSTSPSSKGKSKKWWRKISPWRLLATLVFAGIAAGVGLFVVMYATTKIPSVDSVALAQKTTVYYSDGQTVMGTFGEFDRVLVSLDKIPVDMQHAVVASEDRSFYTNNGIDLKGIARALVNNMTGGARQGASTLTQQYVERYYTGQTTSYVGKAREAILALKIDQVQSKDEILENYLNTIYFGRGAYGVEAASQKYFGIPASEMNVSQSALLAGIIPAPSAWDPRVSEEGAQKAQQRWERVLRIMVEDGYITQEEADAQVMPETIEFVPSNTFAGPNGYILSAIQSELAKAGEVSAEELGQMGLKVTSTIDPAMQKAAVDAVDALPSSRPDNNYVGLVSMDPTNGEIVAMYGGADYLARQQNSATQDHAQAGSTFKVFTLAAAMEQNISLYKVYPGEASKIFNGVKVQNSGNVGYGSVNLLQATAHSVNTAFVALNQEVGPENTRAAAIQAGIPENTPGLESNLVNTLGSATPTPVDMARAYGVFAADGIMHEPHLVREAANHKGEVVYRGDVSGTRVFDKRVSQEVTYALQQVTKAGGSGDTAGKLNRPVAGKTGTSSGPWSAWFCGFTPQMVTVVDMYQVGPNGEEEIITPFGKYRTVYGGTYPTDIWYSYMKVATKDMPVEKFPSDKLKLKAPSPTPTPSEDETDAGTGTPSGSSSPTPTQSIGAM